MRKLLSALVLSLIITSQTFSKEPSTAQIIPDSAFTPIVLPYDEIPDFPTPSPTQKPATKKVNRLGNYLVGTASWYCDPPQGYYRCTIGHRSGYYAAIRKDLLELKGRTILVCRGTKCIPVKIIDCNCAKGANLIDLYADAFRALNDGSTSRGTMTVTIKW